MICHRKELQLAKGKVTAPTRYEFIDGPLTKEEVEQFLTCGFIRLAGAFTQELAAQCRESLWKQLQLSPDDPAGWTKPVIRLGSQSEPMFCECANTTRLYQAFDQLVGPGGWIAHPRLGGSMAVRFPVEGDPGDDGWHVDGSFEKEGSYWINMRSDGRALLMLFLFSDVGINDAPTRIRVGSHLDVPGALKSKGFSGLPFAEVMSHLGPDSFENHSIAYATGEAGDVYLCHPFLVHAAQRHTGTEPRFLAQPGLQFSRTLDLEDETSPLYPVQFAIRLGLGLLR